MPTENRSSTIEQHDHIEGIIDMVSVPREPTRKMLAAAQEVNGIFPTWRAMLAAAPAPQPHPEPIAWMVGTAIWWTKEEAERDAAATGLPIVGLGPMTGAAPAEQRQSEPAGWQFYQDGKWWNGDDRIKDHRKNTEDAGYPVRDVFAQADPGEVERLRAALKFYADREHYHFESGDWDTVSGEPLNILWRGEEPDFIEDGTVARGALERQL